MNDTTYPVIRIGSGTATHATNPSSPHKETFCGINLDFYESADADAGQGVTCKRCRRSLESRSGHGYARARATLAIGQ